MFRSLVVVAVSFVVVGCGPADQMTAAGRCTADAQCPVGASCDAKIGVCVTASTTATTEKPLPAEYGKYCEKDSHCAGIAGTTCNYYQCTYSCANGATCQTGTTCGSGGATGPVAALYAGCFQNCTQASDCKSGTPSCGTFKPSSGAEFKACSPKWPSDLGGTCKDDLGCGEDYHCLIDAQTPNGYCSKSCTTNSDCWGGLCIRSSASAPTGMCAPKCNAPGTQSSCVAGTSCRALSNVSYGFCI